MNRHDCSTELREVNLSVTPARISAMQFFEKNDKPFDALSLTESLAKEGVDRVTAFRILNAFVEKGILRKLEFLEGKARYELTSRGDHHHFICKSCGTVIDIEDTIIPKFENTLEKKYGFTITNHSLEFFGICESCKQ